jgi:hypothetical protein
MSGDCSVSLTGLGASESSVLVTAVSPAKPTSSLTHSRNPGSDCYLIRIGDEKEGRM